MKLGAYRLRGSGGEEREAVWGGDGRLLSCVCMLGLCLYSIDKWISKPVVTSSGNFV